MKEELDANVLLRVTERYAGGQFEILFDYVWTDIESFIKSALVFIPKRQHKTFISAIREAVK